ncbi:MAG: topoisomerase [Hyphomicrobiales bacterium]|nr:topoisomerase [Hyphomicrobiales bacterium]
MAKILADRNSPAALAKQLKLRIVSPADLLLSRRRSGKGFRYFDESGKGIVDKSLICRLASLAVPPAYRDVRYAQDERAHLQAVGYDAAGRLQYRYHADWELVREALKGRRLASFAQALPRIRRHVNQQLSGNDLSKAFAIAAVVQFVSLTVIRAGNEEYARERGTRGATTLLKSNVVVGKGSMQLRFKAKGAVGVNRDISHARLAKVISRLLALPGRRLFQYKDEAGIVRQIRAGDVNAYLKEIVGAPASLKDFRTLVASAGVLQSLSQIVPAESQRKRRSQILTAVREAAEELSNTPTVCQKSYVHRAVISAFEKGSLQKYADELSGRSKSRPVEILAEIVAAEAVAKKRSSVSSA